jgi:hypothetical protein
MKNKCNAVVTSCLPLMNSCGLQDSKIPFARQFLIGKLKKKKKPDWILNCQPQTFLKLLVILLNFWAK